MTSLKENVVGNLKLRGDAEKQFDEGGGRQNQVVQDGAVKENGLTL